MKFLEYIFRLASICLLTSISARAIAANADGGNHQLISTTPVNIIEGNQANAWLGYRETSVGDVNGDGYDDVIVSAYGYDDNGLQDQGAVFLYLGTAHGLSATPAAKLESNQAGAAFGRSVASAGDVNGDGYADVIIGAHLYSDGESEEGAAFLYLGSATGLSTTPAAILEGNQASAWFGYSVASAGDVNGDGYSDVIVGAFKYDDNGLQDQGAAFVYLGSPSGISTTPVAILECNQANASFGISVANVGDVNGDGYSDVMVGAIYYNNGHTEEGAVFLYAGSASGLSTTPVWQQSAGQDYAFMGTRISSGDINGDGYSDVVVGSFLYDNTLSDEGAVFVYYGSPTGLPAAPDVLLTGGQAGAWFGYGVSIVGDINGDGYSDLVVGAPLYDDNGNVDEGAAFVYLGSASGIAAEPVATLESNVAGSSFGDGIAGAGDINGDGIDDFMVGASLYSGGKSAEGALFVYLGEGVRNHARNDFDGDGKSDLLFLNTNTGGTRYWKGAAKTQAIYPGAYDLNYSYQGSGDFDGDGKADLFFTRASNHFTLIWKGAVKSTATYPGASTAGFNVAAICDVNGDGKDDVVWFNPTTGGTQIWSGAVKTSITYPGSQSTAYSVAACADFDGDGKADIFWHNTTTGANQIWLSGNKTTKLYPGTAGDLTWMPVGAGDVDGDGKNDLVWFKPSTGGTMVWKGGLKSAATYPGASASGFAPKAIGDYNGDGKADLFWANDSTLATQIWPGVEKSAMTYPGTYPAGFTVQK
jgi:hypothetical protein